MLREEGDSLFDFVVLLLMICTVSPLFVLHEMGKVKESQTRVLV